MSDYIPILDANDILLEKIGPHDIERWYRRWNGLKVLCLCMIYTPNAEVEMITGQGPRDFLKCEAMSSVLGMHVSTLDNKHDSIQDHHCYSSFNTVHRLSEAMQLAFSDPSFHFIILDWYFSPDFWIRTRWANTFFSETLPWFASSNILKSDGLIYLPNFPVVSEYITEFKDKIEEFYIIELEEDDHFNNPLYCAGAIAQEQLLTIVPPLYNLNQLQHLQNPAFPFYVLTKKRVVVDLTGDI